MGGERERWEVRGGEGALKARAGSGNYRREPHLDDHLCEEDDCEEDIQRPQVECELRRAIEAGGVEREAVHTRKMEQ